MLPYPPQAHSVLELLFLAARHNFRIAVGLASLALFVVFIVWAAGVEIKRRRS